MRIVDAVRASMSIPLFYNAVLIDQKGNRMRTNTKNDSLHILVDGGVLQNFPITVFDSTKFVNEQSSSPNTYMINNNTLGILLENEEFAATEKYYPIRNLKSYINALYHTNIDKPLMSATDSTRSIVVSLKGVSPMVRKIPKSTMRYLINQGKMDAKNFLELP